MPPKELSPLTLKSYLVLKKKPQTEDLSLLTTKEPQKNKKTLTSKAALSILSQPNPTLVSPSLAQQLDSNSANRIATPNEKVKIEVIEKAVQSKPLRAQIETVIVESAITDTRQSDVWRKANNPLIQVQSKKNKRDPQHAMSVTGLSKELLSSLNQGSFEALVNAESKNYNKLKNSPIIDTIGKTDTRLFGNQVKPVKVYCDSSVSSSLAIISGLFGGTIKCKQLDFNSFIEKRLKKGSNKKPDKNN
ncbi:MAG: hypothetical protein ACI97K_003183 [Glaciecola sp.]